MLCIKMISFLNVDRLKMIFNWIFFLLITLHLGNCKSKNDFTSNQIEVQFDLVEPFEWSNADIFTFKSFIAESVAKYCFTNLTACGMSSYKNFTAGDVLIVGDLKIEYVNTIIQFGVRLPFTTSANGSLYVPRIVLTEVVTANRLKLQQRLLASSGQQFEFAFRVSFVNQVLVLPESNQTLNNIITPIICVIVLIMVMVVIGLEIRRSFHRKKKLRNARERARLVLEQKTSNYDM